MTNGNGAEAAPPGSGLTTVMVAEPGAAMSPDGMRAMRRVHDDKLVGRAAPLKYGRAGKKARAFHD